MHRACISIAAVLATAVLATPAAADTFCVLPEGSCPPGKTYASPQSALQQAAGALDADTILLGAATYAAVSTNGFSYTASGPVVIKGKGGDTILTAPSGASGVLKIAGAGSGSEVESLKIAIPASAAANAIGLNTSARTSYVSVYASPTQSNPITGILLTGGAAMYYDNVSLLGGTSVTRGIEAQDPGSIIAASTIAAVIGIRPQASGTVMDGLRIATTAIGVQVTQPQTTLRNCIIELRDTSGFVYGVQSVAPGAAVDNCAILGDPADTQSYGIMATEDGNAGSSLTATSDLIRGTHYSFARGAGAGTPVDLTVRYSAFDPATVYDGGPGTYDGATGNINPADPRYVDAANEDFRLLGDSPLIDAGGGGLNIGIEQLDGGDRLLDGNGDGQASVDIGPFEYQRIAPVAQLGGPSSGAAGVELTFAAGGTDENPGETSRLAFTWAVDGVPAPSGQQLQQTFAYGGTHHVVLTVTDPAGAKATAERTLEITGPAPGAQEPGSGSPGPGAGADRRAPKISRLRVRGRRATFSVDEAATVDLRLLRGKRPVLHRVLHVHAGTSRVRLTGLRAGRYRVVLRATDAAGNRSRPVGKRFRR